MGVDLAALGIDPALLDPNSDNVTLNDDDDDDNVNTNNNDDDDDVAPLDLTKDVVVPEARISRDVHALLADDADGDVEVHVADHELNDPDMLAQLAYVFCCFVCYLNFECFCVRVGFQCNDRNVDRRCRRRRSR
jgi:hypothetical protein